MLCLVDMTTIIAPLVVVLIAIAKMCRVDLAKLALSAFIASVASVVASLATGSALEPFSKTLIHNASFALSKSVLTECVKIPMPV